MTPHKVAVAPRSSPFFMRLSIITIFLTVMLGAVLLATTGPGALEAVALTVGCSLLGLASQHWLRSLGTALMFGLIFISLGLLYLPVFVLMVIQVFREEVAATEVAVVGLSLGLYYVPMVILLRREW